MQPKLGLAGWKFYWLCSDERKGQAGVAIFSKCASGRKSATCLCIFHLAARQYRVQNALLTSSCCKQVCIRMKVCSHIKYLTDTRVLAGQSLCQCSVVWASRSMMAWGAA